MQNDRHEEAAALERRWASDLRWRGIRRAYQGADVLRLRPSVRVEHTLARLGAGPTAVLDSDLVTIRNASAYPRHLDVDVAAETITFHGGATVGPLSDEGLRKKAETTLLRLFRATVALESAVFGEVFRRLDVQGWTLMPGQPLFPTS